jgi:hypothetical protein
MVEMPQDPPAPGTDSDAHSPLRIVFHHSEDWAKMTPTAPPV